MCWARKDSEHLVANYVSIHSHHYFCPLAVEFFCTYLSCIWVGCCRLCHAVLLFVVWLMLLTLCHSFCKSFVVSIHPSDLIILTCVPDFAFAHTSLGKLFMMYCHQSHLIVLGYVPVFAFVHGSSHWQAPPQSLSVPFPTGPSQLSALKI